MKRALFLVLLLCAKSYGAKLPDDVRELVIDDFSGGLLTSYPGDKIPLNYSPNLRNVFIDEGRIRQINGFTRVGSTNTLQKVTGIFPFIQEDGEVRFVVTDSSVALETTNFNSYVFISSALNTGTLLRCIQVRNKMWCSNGSDSVFTWDRTSRVKLDGTNGTPNVTKFKYMTYWQNRVFGLNTPADASALSWSDVKSTAGAQIAPDHFLAWPAGNTLSVGQGDGQTGNGTWVQDGQLRICKDKSLYTIYGTNSSSYFDRKDDSQVGCISHDSIAILDGRSYLFGNDGIYENRQRITDDIQDEVSAVEKASVKTVQNLWETQSDFGRGDFTYGSTATPSGVLTIQTDGQYSNIVQSTEPTTDVLQRIDSSVSLIQGIYASSMTLPPSFAGYVFTFEMWGRCLNSGCPIEIDFNNTRTGEQEVLTKTIPVTADFRRTTWTFLSEGNGSKVTVTQKDINEGNILLRVTRPVPYTTEIYDFYTATNVGKSTLFLAPTLSAQFTSEVSTLAMVTAWGNFESVGNTNGGQIAYAIRTSTSAVNITTQAWASITPGVRINAPTINNYVQWAATVTSVSSFTNTTNIDNVSIAHIEGAGALNRPFAIDWGNRIYVAVATETSGNFSILYVKSKITNKNPHAWMPIYGINIRSFAKDASETFYGGSASSGVFYRLDYGTNFDGQAIESVYETPNLIMDSPYRNKYIFNYLVSGEREASNSILIGTSSEGGSFSETTLSVDGSGTFREMIEGVTNSGAKNIRLRLRHNSLDKSMSVDDIRVLWKPTAVYK